MNIVITGASSGIGKALYESLSDPKTTNVIHNVVGISRRGPDIKFDLEETFPEKPFVKNVALLINCAGILTLPESQEIPHKIFQVNFWGTYYMIQNLLPSMKKGACIINIASVSGMKADPETPLYGASKAAIISLTQSLAKSLAPNIRVNCISPGFYKTNLVPGKIPRELLDTIPLGYAESPYKLYEVVKTIWETKYMTGANIVVDGGVSL